MNYMQLITSLLSGGRGKKLLKMVQRRRSNNNWIWLSLLGVTILGLLGGRNKQVQETFQNGIQQAKNTFQDKPQRNPFEVNFNLATEIAKEIKPDFEPPQQDELNR